MASVNIDLTAQEIAALKQVTKTENDADAVARAAREFLRLSRLRELKDASGKVDFDAAGMSPATAPQWSAWLDIGTAESSTGPFADRPGAYEIRALDSTRAEPIRVPRLGSVDYSGLLYIGCSRRSIAKRVRIFRTIHRPYLLAVRMLPRHELQVRVKLLPAGEAYVEEQRELVRYGELFGEGPPCNRNAART